MKRQTSKRISSVKKYILIILIGILLLATASGTLFASKDVYAANRANIVRVGFYHYPGMFTYENGVYTGYTYEYLLELNQYTGYTYVFEEYPDIMTMLGALKNGEIDLCGGFKYHSSVLPYGNFIPANYGTAHRILCYSKNNTLLESGSLFQYDALRPLKVAIDSSTTDEIKDKIKTVCLSYGLKDESFLKFVVFENIEDAKKSVELPENDPNYADLFNEIELNRPENCNLLATYDPFPVYFLTHDAENSTLSSQMSNAIRTLSQVNPHFEIDLMSKYFGFSDDELVLTQAEKDYIASLGKLKVGVASDKAPIQFADSKGNVKGIGVDILKKISELTGLQFEYITMSTQSELLEKLKIGEVDLTPAMPYEYDKAEERNIVFTRSYMVSPLMLAVNKNMDQQTSFTGKRIALPKGLSYTPTGEEGEIRYFEEVSDCLKAVDSGESDYAYGNANVIQYYMNVNNYKNVVTVSQNNEVQKMCVALSKPVNPLLLSVFNKTIATFTTVELQAILMRNMGDSEISYSFYEFIEENSVVIIICLCLLFIVIIGGIVLIFTVNLKKNQRIAMESSRYKELSALTNEYIFEYDYTFDRIKLNREFAQEFNLPEEQIDFVKYLTESSESFPGEYRFMQGVLSQDDYREDFCIPNARGEERWVRVVSKTVRDKAGKRIFSIGKFGDIQEEKEEQISLEEKAKRDSLTGLWNPAETKTRIAEGIENGVGAMIVLDVDRFKMVNDTYGHVVGDRVLETISKLLKKYFTEDIVGRLGGDEFCVFLNDADQTISKRIAAQFNNFQRELGETVFDGIDQFISVSAGIAFASGNNDFETLYRNADKAMYEAKSRGGRCIVEYSEKQDKD